MSLNDIDFFLTYPEQVDRSLPFALLLPVLLCVYVCAGNYQPAVRRDICTSRIYFDSGSGSFAAQ